MARPLKTGIDYFQHDTSMSSDEKIEALESIYKNDGYAVYCKILERIYRNRGELDLTDPVQHLSIAKKCNVSADKFDKIIEDAVRFKLFDPDVWATDHRLSSARIERQIDMVESERIDGRVRKNNISTRKTPEIGGFPPGKLDTQGGFPPGKVHKGEESRGENIREEIREPQAATEQPSGEGELPRGKRKIFIPPTLEEVREYCLANHYSIDPEKFIKFYESSDPPWHDSKGNKVKNWKGKVITWAGREKENQSKGLSTRSGAMLDMREA